jgi:3-hydroxyisobutyrate dehydrogenase-like beta-hydroxyacid dehydrogenase
MVVRVGYLGIGNMGGPLAERLVGKVELAVCDRDSERVAAFTAKGAEAAASPRELAARSDIVLTCLPASKDVRSILFGDEGLAAGAADGLLIADMTTGDPNATREMAGELAPRGIELIDAPVSGGPRGAREGTIAIMVGGSDAQYARAKEVLDLISVNVVHAGSVGAGHAIKAGNNILNLICRMATFEVVSLLVKDGVDPGRAVDIIQKSSGRNYSTEITLPDNILSGKMVQGFTTALMTKDAGVALDIARAHNLDMPIGTLAQELLQRTIEEFGSDADMSTVALTYERLTGARIRPEGKDE